MSAIEHEVASQPDALAAGRRRSRRDRTPARHGQPAGRGRLRHLALHRPGYAALARGGRATARPTPSPPPRCPPAAATTRVVAISRSGTTTEVLDAARPRSAAAPHARDHRRRRQPGRRARPDDGVVLDFADERSVVQTRFATRRSRCCARTSGSTSTPAAAAAERALAAPLPVDPAGFDRFLFLGRGWTVGLAAEAALKLREAGAGLDRGLPRDGVPARPDRAGRPAHARLVVRPARPTGWPTTSRATGATLVAPTREPLATLVLVPAAGGRARRRARPRPRHPPQPDPIGGAPMRRRLFLRDRARRCLALAARLRRLRLGSERRHGQHRAVARLRATPRARR